MGKIICPQCDYEFNKDDLTSRELEVAFLICEGLVNYEIAEKLFISYRTVKNHVYNLYRKCGVDSRIKLYKYMLKKGYIRGEDKDDYT